MAHSIIWAYGADARNDDYYFLSSEDTGSNTNSGGVFTGMCLTLYGAYDPIIVHPPIPGAPHTTLFTAFHYMGVSNSPSERIMLEFYDQLADSPQVTVTLQFMTMHGKYRLRVRRGGISGTVLATADKAIVPNGFWCHVSALCHVDGTNGVLKINVDRKQIVNFTGNTQNTANARIDRIRYRVQPTLTDARFDNIVVATGLTSDPLLPEIRIHTHIPDANDAVQFSVSGAASNWAAVDETPPNGSTDYTYSSTVGHQDTFSSTATDAGSLVHALQVCYGARKDDASTRLMRAVVKPGTTSYDAGADDVLLNTYTAFKKIWETNPETSAPWTQPQAVAAKFGYKLTG